MHLPDDGAGTDVLALMLAVEHRSARHDDGGDVATGGTHQQGRRGFVTASQQHDAIDGVAANRFFNVHARQVASEHCGRAQVGFAVGKHRKLDRPAACFDHATFDVFGDLPEMRVAGGQLRPGIANADDRFALELMVGNTLILHPATVHEAILVSGAKPLGRTEGRFFIGVRHDRLSYCKT